MSSIANTIFIHPVGEWQNLLAHIDCVVSLLFRTLLVFPVADSEMPKRRDDGEYEHVMKFEL